MALPHRIVWFSLSKALAESQDWAVDSFPTIVLRATGSSERWTLKEQTYDAARETPMWRYEVQAVSDLDLVVDHIIHELTDAVLLTELHTVTEDAYTFGSMQRDRPEKQKDTASHTSTAPPPSPSPSRPIARGRAMGAPEGWVGVKQFLLLLTASALILCTARVQAQEQAKPAPPRSPEAALAVVAKHLSDHYALYLYESLTAQILFNEGILERPNSSSAPKAKDSLWALGIISDSILAEEEDGEYLNIDKVPEFFEDVVHRYLNASHYWPDREITKDTRREHLAAWYSIYLMLLVGNATQEEIAKKLRNGAFTLDPEMLKTRGPSLVDRLKKDGALTKETYALVQIKRAGQAGRESLSFPSYMDRWKAKIESAYDLTPSP